MNSTKSFFKGLGLRKINFQASTRILKQTFQNFNLVHTLYCWSLSSICLPPCTYMEDSGILNPLNSKPQGRCLTFLPPNNDLGQVPNPCLFSNLRAQCFFPKIHTKFPNLQGRMLVHMRAHEDLLGEANIGGNDLPWKQRAARSGHERPQKRDLAASCRSFWRIWK